MQEQSQPPNKEEVEVNMNSDEDLESQAKE